MEEIVLPVARIGINIVGQSCRRPGLIGSGCFAAQHMLVFGHNRDEEEAFFCGANRRCAEAGRRGIFTSRLDVLHHRYDLVA